MWQAVLRRNLHTSTICTANMGKVMRKVMGQSSKRKKIFSESGILPNAEMLTKGSNEGRYSGSARRASVLNKLFMKHITDLLATGEYASEFIGHGVEINRVQISPDYHALNIFWVAKGTEEDETVEKLLKKHAGFLRHELSSLRVMGNVPTIQFVKDKKFSQIIEVDARLAKADFGEDYVPTEMATKLKTQLELFTHLPLEVKEKIEELDGEVEEEIIEDPLPPMPQDVLGLNHAEILNRIKKNMKKSEALHRVKGTYMELEQSINENPIEYGSNKERREAFKEFLQKRELQRSKTRKMEKNYIPDIEYMKEEFEERRAEFYKNLDMFEDEVDYFSEEEIENK